MMKHLVSLDEDRPALVINRRAVANGLAALLGMSTTGAAQALSALTNIPTDFSPSDFVGQMQDGLFLPDYRIPMVRAIYDDGTTTNWNRYGTHRLVKHPDGRNRLVAVPYGKSHQHPNATRLVAMELCCPDSNGNPRYAQLSIG